MEDQNSGTEQAAAPDAPPAPDAQPAPSKSAMRAEAKGFYKSLFAVVAPIALQNFISAAVSSADVVMLGSVGQTALAASSLAGQVQFVLFLFFTGISSGMIMLTTQYWGKKDAASIETITGFAFRFACCAGFLFMLAALFAPRLIMRIFTNEGPLINEGARYLRCVSFSYAFLAFSQVFQAALKSIERVVTVTAITMAALALNIVLNAVFIFGLFGAPKLGIMGAGIATSVARAVELAMCAAACSRVKSVRISVRNVFRKNAVLFRDYLHYSMPALGNELVWGAAFAAYSVILGHLGEDIVAANSVASVARNLGSVLCFGMAYGGAILLGKQMGGGDLRLAERHASRLWRSTALAGLLGAAVIVLLKPLLLGIGNLSPAAQADLRVLVYINALSIFGAAVNTVLICGIFRAGGDAHFGFVLDSVMMWCVSIPLGLAAWFLLKLPPVWVYLVLYLDEFEKMPFIVAHYRKKGWLNNITKDFSAEAEG